MVLYGLIGIAEEPETHGHKAVHFYPRVPHLHIQRGIPVRLSSVIEGQAFFQEGSGRGQLSTPEQNRSQCPMGFYDEGWLLRALSQLEELFTQRTRSQEFRPTNIKLCQPRQRWE